MLFMCVNYIKTAVLSFRIVEFNIMTTRWETNSLKKDNEMTYIYSILYSRPAYGHQYSVTSSPQMCTDLCSELSSIDNICGIMLSINMGDLKAENVKPITL